MILSSIFKDSTQTFIDLPSVLVRWSAGTFELNDKILSGNFVFALPKFSLKEFTTIHLNP